MLTIKIQTGSAAFTDAGRADGNVIARNAECTRILRKAANELEVTCSPRDSLYLADSNGNKVGTLTINNR